MAAFSPQLQAFIDASFDRKRITSDINTISSEIHGFLANRPLVVLQKGDVKICYLRPGVDDAIQQAFLLLGLEVDVPKKPLLNKVIDFTDFDSPVQCSKNPDDLQKLYDTCIRVGLVRELYLEIVTNDTDYFKQVSEPNPQVCFTPLGISECACRDRQNNRLFSETRYVLENQVIKHLKANKNQPIEVISMGSGGLLQDWKLLGLLVKEGFKEISWAAVDPINKKNPQVQKMKEFLSHISGVAITFTAYSSIEDVPDKQVDAIVAFDVPAIVEDLAKSYTLLSDSGKLFYGSSDVIFEISKDKTDIPLMPPECLEAYEDMIQQPSSEFIVKSDLFEAAGALAALSSQGIKEAKFSIEWDEQTYRTSAQTLFSFLFPSMSITIMP